MSEPPDLADRTAEGSDQIRVGVAEYATTDEGAILSTSGLGSCLGVCIYERGTAIGGLVHVMQPSADDANPAKPGKYADTGIRVLYEEIEELSRGANSLVAKIAGGSSMLGDSLAIDINTMNVKAVRSELCDIGIEIAAEDLGGDHGRSITFHPVSGKLEVDIAHGPRRVL